MTLSPNISRSPALRHCGDRQRSSPMLLLSGHEQRPAAEVNAFVDWLAGMPLAVWLGIGRGVANERTRITARGVAWDELQRAICAHELQISSWFVRDAVETAAFLASHSVRRWSPEDRRFFAAAHGAAEISALALLARPFLELPHFESLYEPVAGRADVWDRLTTNSPRGRLWKNADPDLQPKVQEARQRSARLKGISGL